MKTRTIHFILLGLLLLLPLQAHAQCTNEGPYGDPSCSDGQDNDCDGFIDLYDVDCQPCSDVDQDGYGTTANSNCPHPELDCDDLNPDIHPAAVEGIAAPGSCSDGIDNDCDRDVDMEEATCTPCTDGDGDGYGSIGNPNCGIPYVLDCDDSDPDVNPAATESLEAEGTCSDEVDNDCNGEVDAAQVSCIPCLDADGDGYGNPPSPSCAHPETDCNDSDPAINPGVLEGPMGDATCDDDIDNDCDSLVDLYDFGCQPCRDMDQDGYGDPASPNCPNPERDCDDLNPDISPAVSEGPLGSPMCSDQIDNDCDRIVDARDPGCTPCIDEDGDGYGSNLSENCPQVGLDCVDSVDEDSEECATCRCGTAVCSPCARCINPGTKETIYDTIDNDCDSTTPPWGVPLNIVATPYKGASDIVNYLAFLLVPAAAVFLFKGRKRKK